MNRSVDLALASLRIWAVEVDLAGETYTVPALSAAEWFMAVLSGESAPVVPGMLDAEEQEQVIDRLLSGEVTAEQLDTANHEALAAASGWKWWEAERLIVSAAVEWRIIGGLLQGQGLDLNKVSVGAVLSAMYAMAVGNMKKEDRFTFDAQLSAPPASAIRKDDFDQSVYADAFADLLRAHQSKTLPQPDKATGQG